MFSHRISNVGYLPIGGTLLVSQVVEALRYKPEGRGSDSRWCHWNFSLTYSFRLHIWIWVMVQYTISSVMFCSLFIYLRFSFNLPSYFDIECLVDLQLWKPKLIFISLFSILYFHTLRIITAVSIWIYQTSFFYVLLTVHLSVFMSVINQLDAQKFCFTISLFHGCTFFDHTCSSSGGLKMSTCARKM